MLYDKTYLYFKFQKLVLFQVAFWAGVFHLRSLFVMFDCLGQTKKGGDFINLPCNGPLGNTQCPNPR
jgi:hypothetical protein